MNDATEDIAPVESTQSDTPTGPSESIDEDQSEVSPVEPPLVSLTRLQSVRVGSVWPTEARHFTPWLLQNGDLLSEVLGIDVELESREYKVGKFSLDIIGREVSTGSPVIIENQYGPTDHNHLGQILTYAGGTKPTTIVWIAEDFREEHRAALEWLNTHTDPAIRFFGVRLSAVTLDGAPAGLIAPFLELVVKPNEWEKEAAAATLSSAAGPTATQDLYRQFWSKFEPLAKQRGWTHASAPAQNWWDLPSGITGATWGVSYAQFGCRSELYFRDPKPSVNLARWQVLHERRADLESIFGDEVLFDDLPKNKGCRIEVRYNGPKISDKDQWSSVIAWMIDTQERLRKAVLHVGGIPTVTPGTDDDSA